MKPYDEPCCGNCNWWEPDFLPERGLAYGEAPCCWGACGHLFGELEGRGAYQRQTWWMTEPCAHWEVRA